MAAELPKPKQNGKTRGYIKLQGQNPATLRGRAPGKSAQHAEIPRPTFQLLASVSRVPCMAAIQLLRVLHYVLFGGDVGQMLIGVELP